MHSAPAVNYPVGRSNCQAVVLALVLLGSAVVLLGWLVAAAVPMLKWVGAVVLWLVLTGLALRRWWCSPGGTLAWDGTCWCWTVSGTSLAVVPQLVLDFQDNLLLRLAVTKPPQSLWLWPERRLQPANWVALRRAIVERVATADNAATHADAAPTPPITTGARP